MDHHPLKLKEIEYPNNWQGTSRVAYALFDGGRCVFSGLPFAEGGTPTVLAAERIIELIAQHERLNLRTYRFFDLQTRCQHGGYDCPHDGEYEFEELILQDNPNQGLVQTRDEQGNPVLIAGPPESIHVSAWHRVPCPKEVLATFRVLIGDLSKPAYQCKSPSDHDPNRPHPSDPQAQARNVHPDILPLYDSIEQKSWELLKRPGKRDVELERQIGEDWTRLRECIESGRFLTPQTIISLETCMQIAHRSDAVEFLNRHMLRLLPESPGSLCELGWTFEKQGRLREAEEVYTVAGEAYAKIFARQGVDFDSLLSSSLEVARRLAETTVTMVDAGDVFRRRARVQLAQRKLAEALVSAEHAHRLHLLGLQPKSEPLQLMAEVLVRQGNPDGAKIVLKRCFQIHKEHKQWDFLDVKRARFLSRALTAGSPDPIKLLDYLDTQVEE